VSRSAHERRVSFIRPAGVSRFSLAIRTVDTVQDAMNVATRKVLEIITHHGRKIRNDHNYWLREISREGIAAAWKVAFPHDPEPSLDTIDDARQWLLNNKAMTVFEHAHADGHHVCTACRREVRREEHWQHADDGSGLCPGARAVFARTRGEKGPRLSTTYRILQFRETLDFWCEIGELNGKPLCFGAGNRTGPGPVSFEVMEEYHVERPERGLRHAAALGERRKAIESGDVVTASEPPPPPQAFDPPKLELPPVRPDAGPPPRQAFAALNAIAGGASHQVCWQFIDFIRNTAGAEISDEQVIDYLIRAGQRVQQARKHTRIPNIRFYLLRTLQSVIGESPPSTTGPPVSEYELPLRLRPLLALDSTGRTALLRSLGYPEYEHGYVDLLQRVLTPEEWAEVFG
jgi:hypothetical protein